jgi:hypothetical protein
MRATALAVATLAGACGDNLTGPAFEPWQLDELSAGEGLWVRTGEFEVPSGTEIQDCYFFEIPAGGADLWIDRFQLALNPGSHHMNLYRVGSIVNLDPASGAPIDLGGVPGAVVRGGECWNAANLAGWPLVVNSQQSAEQDPVFEWSLPPTIAVRFTPGERLMLQVHYANTGAQETPFRGRAGLNLLRSDDDTVELGALLATQQRIRVCRSTPPPVYSGTCAMPSGGEHRVAAVNGHFHSRGQRFSVYAWDGMSTVRPPDSARFYVSDEWAEPDMLTGLDVRLAAAGGIWWTCEYQWREPEIGCAAVDLRDPLQANDCCYTFGGEVESSEHCNVFLYYHPKTEDIDCFSDSEPG